MKLHAVPLSGLLLVLSLSAGLAAEATNAPPAYTSEGKAALLQTLTGLREAAEAQNTDSLNCSKHLAPFVLISSKRRPMRILV